VDKSGRKAIEDNGEGQSRSYEDIQVAEKDSGRYLRDGSQAWRVAVDARLSNRTGPAIFAASPIRE